jgi:hypothetical protein
VGWSIRIDGGGATDKDVAVMKHSVILWRAWLGREAQIRSPRRDPLRRFVVGQFYASARGTHLGHSPFTDLRAKISARDGSAVWLSISNAPAGMALSSPR